MANYRFQLSLKIQTDKVQHFPRVFPIAALKQPVHVKAKQHRLSQTESDRMTAAVGLHLPGRLPQTNQVDPRFRLSPHSDWSTIQRQNYTWSLNQRCSPPAAPPASPALEKLPMAECPLTSRVVPDTVDPPVWAPNKDCNTDAPPSGNWDPRYCPTDDPVVEETATGLPPTFPLRIPPPLVAAAEMKRFWLARLLLVFRSQSRGVFCFWWAWRCSELPPPPWAPLPPLRLPASWLRKGLGVM